MAKQLLNIGTLPNDNTGDPIRDGGDKINDNFNEIYGAIGDGSTLSIDVSNPVNGEALIYNSSTGKFESNSIGSVLSTLRITDDSSTVIGIDLTTETLEATGGLGIVSTVSGNQLKFDIDQSIVITQTGTETLSNKTLDGLSNTFTNIPNSALVNSELTIMDSTSTTDTVALGETLHITGSNAITTSVANNVLTIDLAPASKCTTLGTTVLELGCTTTCLQGLTCFELASGAEMRLRGFHPSGTCNVAIGATSDMPNAANARCNVAIGHEAMIGVVDGYDNTGIGRNVLCGLSDGRNNVAVGTDLLRNVGTGNHHIAIGDDIMRSFKSTNLTDINGCNIAIGLALFDHIPSTGICPKQNCNNIAIGYAMGQCICAQYRNNILLGQCQFTTARCFVSNNIGIGNQALVSAAGSNNIAIGDSSLSNSMTGYNIAIGRNSAQLLESCAACQGCTLDENNPPAVSVGFCSAPNWTTTNYCYGCTFAETPSIAIGNSAMAQSRFADSNVVIGHYATAISCDFNYCISFPGVCDSVVLGNTASMNNVVNSSIIIGNRSYTCHKDMSCLHGAGTVPTLAHSCCDVIIGTDAFQGADAASCQFGCNSFDNVIIGGAAAQHTRGASSSVIIGFNSYSNDYSSFVTSGIVSIGSDTLCSFCSSVFDPHLTAIGTNAGFYQGSGCGITLVGTNAFCGNSVPASNIVVVGDNALILQGSADCHEHNTVVGSYAASQLSQGCTGLNNRFGYNTLIGSYSGASAGFMQFGGPSWCSVPVSLEDGCNNIIIGYRAEPSTQVVDDEITIGNPANTKFRLPGVQASATDGQVLTHNASTGYLELQDAGGGTLNVIDDSSTAIAITLSTEQLQIAGGAGITTSASGNTITISNTASGSLNVLDDSSTSISIDLGTESLTLVGASGITTSASGNTVTISGSCTGLLNVVEDTTPQLGGNLDLNSNTITGNGNLDIANGTIKLDGNYPISNNNVALGDTALNSICSGNCGHTVAIGHAALTSISTGAQNVGVGAFALTSSATGNYSVAVGAEALRANTQSWNNAIGHQSLLTSTEGEKNVAVGFWSLKNLGNNHCNVAIGHEAGVNLTGGNNNIIIGHNAQASTATTSNQITLGDANITSLRIPGLTSGATTGDVLTWNGTDITFCTINQYTDSDVDTHLNTSSATSCQYLSWSGTDYVWAPPPSTPNPYTDSDVDTHLNTSTAAPNEVLAWNGTDYDWVTQTAPTTLGALTDVNTSAIDNGYLVYSAQAGSHNIQALNIVHDTTPTLGGDLDTDSNSITGGLKLSNNGIIETFATHSGVASTINLPATTSHNLFISSASNNKTLNVSSLTLTSGQGTNITAIWNQGSTPYMITILTINGSSVTINWQGGSAPSGTANGVDVISFSIYYTGSAYVVTGQSVSFS